MLVDTSVWIDHFNDYSSPQADLLRQAIADNAPIYLCGIVVTEILLGIRNERHAVEIEDLLGAFDWLPEPKPRDYLRAARIYRECRSRGITVRSTIDCLIASQCLANDMPVLAKARDFDQIAACQPLSLIKV